MKSLPLLAVLACAACAPRALCQQPPSARNTVNVAITSQRKMLVEAWVDGARGNFLVDTGAGNSYMGEKFADSLHLQRDEGGYSYNVLGSMRFDVVNVETMELGAARIPLYHGLIHVSNLAWANKASAGLIHGIIGADILIRNQAIIDCAQGRIILGNPGAQSASAAKRAVNFIPRRGDEIAVIAVVNGVAGKFIVDTGYNVSLVSPAFAYRLNAGAPARVVRVASLALGASRLPARPGQMVVSTGIDVANQGYIEQGEAPYDGVLGMDFLLGNRAIIDCRQRQLRFD